MRIEVPAVVLACAVAACGAKVDRTDVSTVRTGTVATSGLSLELRSVQVADGAPPIVTFRATDGAGTPLDLAAEIAAGALAPRFTLARVASDGRYAAYLVADVAARPYVDAAGVPQQPAGSATQAIAEPPYEAPWPVERLAPKGDGVYAYTFGTALHGVDPQATHLAAVFATRGATSASASLDLVPAGGTPAPREEVVAAACDRCHAEPRHHDGRRGVKLCLSCHTAQTADPETGNRLDLATLVHKIHKGARLANDWPVVGDGQVVHDWSHVQMAPSHSTYFELGTTGAPPINDPGIVRNCALCHQGADAIRWRTRPTAAACGACHDQVDFTTGTGHVVQGVDRPSADSECAGCHVDGASGTPTIDTVHSERYETTRKLLFGEHALEVRILAVNGAVAGGAAPPTVDFWISLDGKPYDVLNNALDGAPLTNGSLGSLSFQLAGPTTDYARTWPSAFGASSAALSTGKADPTKVTALGTPGTFRFKFPSAIPATLTGSYAVSFEAYWREVQTAGSVVRKPYAANPVFHGPGTNVAYVDLATGGPGAERRAVAATAKCNACHEDLGFHSNRTRKGIDYCATCHDPNLSNAGRARFRASDTGLLSLPAGLPVPAAPVFVAESVASKVFIHRIHMGAELPTVKAGGAVAFGANRTASDPTPGSEGLSDFSAFESPHPMGDCAACHLDGTWALPEVPGLLPVRRAVLDCGDTDADGWCKGRTPNGIVPELVTPPLKAVCTSCHDDDATRAHADLNTVQPMTVDAVETCAGCHGAGKPLDARVVHAAP